MIVTPSDHLITRENEFVKAIEQGFEFVETHDSLLTLGIKPTRPETGYGYIQIGKPVTDDILKVKTFTEKPDIELAKVFLESGEFFWNSGIFLWSAKSIVNALHEYAPDLTNTFDRGEGVFGTPEEKDFILKEFPGCVSISIDYAVMERATNVYVECVSFGWNDLGTQEPRGKRDSKLPGARLQLHRQYLCRARRQACSGKRAQRLYHRRCRRRVAHMPESRRADNQAIC